jgi:hypothetical protein
MNYNRTAYVAIYKLGYNGISKGIIVNTAISSQYNSNNPSSKNLTIFKSNIVGDSSYFNGITSRTTSTINIGNIKTIELIIKPIINTIDILQLSASGKISISSGNLITTTGLSTPDIYVNGQKNGTILLNNWNKISISTNTLFSSDAFIVGYSSSYYKGFIKEIRLNATYLNYLNYYK